MGPSPFSQDQRTHHYHYQFPKPSHTSIVNVNMGLPFRDPLEQIQVAPHLGIITSLLHVTKLFQPVLHWSSIHSLVRHLHFTSILIFMHIVLSFVHPTSIIFSWISILNPWSTYCQYFDAYIKYVLLLSYKIKLSLFFQRRIK